MTRSHGARKWMRAIGFFAPYWKNALPFFLFLVLSAVFGLVSPFLYGTIVDALVRRDVSHVMLPVALSVVAALIAGALRFGQNYYCGNIVRNAGKDLTERLFTKLQRLPLDFFREKTTGEIISLVRTDIDLVMDAVYSQMMPFLVSVAVIATTAISMFVANWRLSLISLAVVPLWIIVTRLNGRMLLPLHQQLRTLYDVHNALISERLSMQGVIRTKTYLGFLADIAAYREVLMPLFRLSQGLVTAYGINFMVSGVVDAIGPGLILVAGAFFVQAHSLTVGMLTAFMALQGRLVGPVQSMVGIRAQVTRLQVSLDRILGTLDLPEEHSGTITVSSANPVRFDNVYAAHGTTNVLENLTFSVAPKEHVALVGASGAGKSTIAHLILGLHQVSAGTITIADIDVRHLSVESLRDSITYVPQETAIFNGTVRENLLYGADDLGDEQIWSALHVVELDEKIRNLPHGLESTVGVSGFRLSGGERQRLALARALLRRRSLFILDEATSSVDMFLERKILNRLKHELKDSALLLISHRLPSLMDFNRIIVLHNGAICESGSYHDLLSSNGAFASMAGTY
jgi:ATP-binding cassette, subfamily B, bacterial